MPIRQFPIRTGRKSSISTSALQLTTVDAEGQRGVQITADSGNSGAVYVGETSAITADGADGTDGYPIAAGETVVIPTLRADELYVIAGSSGHKVWWMLI